MLGSMRFLEPGSAFGAEFWPKSGAFEAIGAGARLGLGVPERIICGPCKWFRFVPADCAPIEGAKAAAVPWVRIITGLCR